jgi:predicted flap endonuclease-1-like 5' DNA nuclease
MKKRRPFGITILAILVGLGALVAIYHMLQFLRVLPFSLGPVSFYAYDLLGAILWGVNAAILIWVASSLWSLGMEGRLFVLVIATLNLILAFISILGGSSITAMGPAILINTIILIYCLLPGVERAFLPDSPPVQAAAQPAVAQAAVQPAVAQAPVAIAAAIAEDTKMVRLREIAPIAAEPEIMEDTKMTRVRETEPNAAALAAAAALLTQDEVPIEPGIAAVAVAPAEPETAALPETAAEDTVLEVPAAAPIVRRKIAIETIEGIGPVYRAKLMENGIVYVADLLAAGASRKGRENLAAATGITGTLILKWVNMADLMRISGIGEEFSELLEAAGVDTVKELRNRIPENLHLAMLEANKQRKMVRRTPHLSEVQSWVKQAKQLEPLMTY